MLDLVGGGGLAHTQVFPHLDASAWPLRVGTFFTQVDQAVRIVAPPEGQRFRPLLPDASLPAPAAPPAL
jgi:hypothetical protein